MPLRLAFLLCAACVVSALTLPAYANEFGKTSRIDVTSEIVWFNGYSGDFENKPTNSNGRIYLSLTDLMRHIDGSIEIQPNSSKVVVSRKGMKVIVTPGSKTVMVDGKAHNLGLPVMRCAGTMYVPLRAMCDVFGVDVTWDSKTRKAYVESAQGELGVAMRSYPWVDTNGGRDYTGVVPGQLNFKNHTGLPVHVRFEGNGVLTDIQIHGMDEIGPILMQPGTYKVTVWSRQGEDQVKYVTVAPGVRDRYEISVGTFVQTLN